MIRKLPFLTVFSVSALFFAMDLSADQATFPDGALPQARANDKLLMSHILSEQENAFEQGMAEAGWDIHSPQNLLFQNVRHIIAKNEVMSLARETEKKLASNYFASRAVNSSA